MIYRLLLVDGQGVAVTSQLRLRMLREFPGGEGLSVHFRPVRSDRLFESAREAGRLAYRILGGEGVVRAQLWVEYEVLGEPINVVGRSSDLLFALALVSAQWRLPGGARFAALAATGVLGPDGSVLGVEHTAEKVAAAIDDLSLLYPGASEEDARPGVIFYPAADAAAVEAAVAERSRAGLALPPHLDLRPVAHLDDALAHLGYTLEKVYLRNPFRGLEHFDYADHAIFFGRDAEVREVIAQLLRREEADAPGLLIEGASGSGKSSFLRAGVLPALVEPRQQGDEVQRALASRPVSRAVSQAIWRPGLLPPRADEAKIAQAISLCWASQLALTGGWFATAGGRPETLEALAAARRAHWPATLRFVWMIDQFEEIQSLSDALVERFGQFLHTLQRDGVWTLASIRADALSDLKRHATLRAVFGSNEGQYYLPSLRGTALDAVISRPAHAAALRFGRAPDGTPLDQRLREDAYREQDALPLLQFTLNELYLKRAGQELTVAAYDELGGLSGSIATAAAAVLAAAGGGAPDDGTRTLPRLFRSLVSVDDTGRATRRYAPLTDVTADPGQKALLDRLIASRLCVTDQRDGHPVVAFAHDTLLNTLPALTDWLNREAGLLQTRELAQRDTHLWQTHGESDDWLAAADKLASFQTLEAADIVLPVGVRTFIERSARRARRTTRRRRLIAGLIVMLGIGVVIGALAFGLQARKAEEAREMTARRGEFLEGLLKSADPRGGKRDVTVAQLLDASTRQIETLAATEPLVAASMLGLIAETNLGLGRFANGLDANFRQLELLRAHGGSRLDLAQSLSTRGELLSDLGRYADGETYLQQSIAVAERQRGAEKILAGALVTLGQDFDEDNRLEDAETVYQRGLALCRRLGAASGGCEMYALNGLGVLRTEQGRDVESLAYYREALALERKYLPADHQDILTGEYNLAKQMAHNHEAAAAEPLFREILATTLRVLGPDHVQSYVGRLGLADDLIYQKRYHEAAAEALQAAEAIHRIAGDDDHWTAEGWGYYGIAACLDGQGDAGLAALRHARELQARQLPTADIHRLYTSVSTGRCLLALRRFAEAEPLLLDAVPALASGAGAQSERAKTGYRALRDLYAATGRSAEAAQWQSRLAPGD